jgi:hypothetical protein
MVPEAPTHVCFEGHQNKTAGYFKVPASLITSLRTRPEFTFAINASTTQSALGA